MKTSDIASERLVIGILAHVDAGKTTLSESLLYLSGSIRKMGRVDKRDTFLDTDETERARGITIYAKQAVFSSPERDRIYTILDTPGHADFSAEMERTLSVLDAAVLLISAADGINAQVRLLWSLLAHHSIPVLIFINKMDQAAAIGEEEHRRQELLSELQQTLSENILDFSDGSTDPGLQEALALSSNDETLLEQVMAGETINDDTIRSMVTRRECFPAVFGSALKMQHTDTLLHLLDTCVQMPASLQTAPSQNEGESLLPQDTYGARVIKISHTPSGERETWLKITNGRLTVRQPVTYPVLFSEDPASDTAADPVDSAFTEEKITQIRLYSGEKYIPLQEALPGTVCTVTGLTGTYAGQGLGTEADASKSLLAPVLAWQILLPPEVDPVQGYRQLKLLEEEDPMLQLHYDERRKEIRAHLMGEVQREILTGQARKRFGWEIRFGLPSVIYKETISAPIEGVGHFEPLRHYAEVHLLLEPGEPGSGLTYEDRCPPDTLPGQYRRQILSELAKRRHRGVLTGSEITDMHISLIGGRAHEKHTCGGDFRQAAWRAVRQGLMMAQNVLLEPFYSFTMLLPSASLGRALTDLQQMNASFQAPEPFSDRGGTSISRITGLAPVASMDAYRETFSAYTRGEGHLELQPGPYRPCADAETVIEDIAYDPDADRGQPSDSVFCMHGAGTRIPWDQVRSYMHVTGCADPYIGIQTDG
ncbi:MAG: TetM/TetW/TetO/TetS family tetracycline resistance ribosomal protection protein, partial [Eubacterium sp.]|nr:TetM/TetW/TetO/TetS family tetracycline resistance ribosomal protection protein [Eubacterium sp.]